MDIIIAAHGSLAAGFKDAANVILGDMAEVSDIKTEQLSPGENIEVFGKRLAEKIKNSDLIGGTIIFVDLLGASPYNQAVLAVKQLPDEEAKKVFVIGEVNLPMLLESLNHKILGSDIKTVIKNLESLMPSTKAVWHISHSLKDEQDDDF